MRLLIVNVIEDENSEPVFKKASLVRVPTRLGEDVFETGAISPAKIKMLIHAVKGYAYLIKAWNIVHYRACATSAMREAKNGKEVVKQIEKETGIRLEIISGEEEASLIFANHIERLFDENKNYLYVDVGGGSTELTLYSQKSKIDSKSFPLGTVRMIKKRYDEKVWEEMRTWIKNQTKEIKPDWIIGSGGNINKLIKLYPNKKKSDRNISLREMQEVENVLKSMSYEERVKNLGLNPDRADVIIPALDIYLAVMRWSKCHRITVPKIGLADGIIHQLYHSIGKN
ncbi:MAG: exopolyphosphatase [Bacteroidetes bacterium]|nr:MAG: exopolyphosphatase [Bacteroidota bacterium]